MIWWCLTSALSSHNHLERSVDWGWKERQELEIPRTLRAKPGTWDFIVRSVGFHGRLSSKRVSPTPQFRTEGPSIGKWGPLPQNTGSSAGKKSTCKGRRPWFDSWIGKIPLRKDRLPTPVFLGFPRGSAGKESACNAGDLGSSPGLGRSSEEGNGYPLWYSGLENFMDCIVHGVAKSRTWLSNFHFHPRTHS